MIAMLLSGCFSAAVAQDSDAKLKVGELAPDFAVTTTDNQQINLRDLKGKPVLLNFFATW